MEDNIFFNQSKYIKEMIKMFVLEVSKPMKTPMSTETKLTKDEECESRDKTKYRGKIQAWFDSSIPYFNGIVDEDGKGYGDDYVLVSKDNHVDKDCSVYEDASVGMSTDEIVNDKLVDEDCNVYDDASAEKPPNDYATENTKPNTIPNHSDDIPSCSILDLNSNQTGMDQELGGAANDPMSICSRPDMHNSEVDCDGMAIDKPNQMNDYSCSQPIPASVNALIQACAYDADHLELDVL
uniref:Retrovirus-related Pol polyprotein from transposon TNT 1-94 n=1 Tax=Tanacetum cinerariifolium TaxID=118510 RepID=A0A6L2LTD4_TANCI|nr:retrovirus-related Pol polyprotein from transposon TNT 1-94 [Tanacetum cinerariifolium]